ncbi:MAG: hypothetical protein EOO07_01835 [Chitinophagaceae bacterium]|nr:MAG: hypothetical protein EOO07_01835 [Chitinophagaceae bacterium]
MFLILLNFVIQIVFTTTPDWNMTRALTEDSIICDMPRADATNQLNLIHHSNQLYQLFYYVTHNFFHFIGLALVRLRYFFTMVRPYYSNFHNFYLIGYLLLFYGSLLIKFKTVVCQLPRPLNAFLFLSILLFAATVALQCDDYHNRFFLTLTPIFAIFTIAAWWPFVKKKIFSSEGRHKD